MLTRKLVSGVLIPEIAPVNESILYFDMVSL